MAAEIERLRRQQDATVSILQLVVKELDQTKRRNARMQDHYASVGRLLSVLGKHMCVAASFSHMHALVKRVAKVETRRSDN